MASIDIEVWVDVVDPWCYIGKRRLEQAIAASPHPAEVTVTYRAFELEPHTPVRGGGGILPWLARRLRVTLGQAREMAERTAVAARPDGIDIEVERQVAANTFDAHRLIALGLAQGGHALQAAVLERFFSAHFTEGKVLDDLETLQRLAGEAGLDGRRVAAVLAADDYADQVRHDERAAAEIGITEVPFFMGNRHVVVTGGHSAEVLGEFLAAAREADHEPAGHPT